VPSTPSTPPAPPGGDGYRPDPDRWMALSICLAAGFMTLLDVSIVNVALQILAELGPLRGPLGHETPFVAR
jgi:hypothetical protein